MQHLEVSCAVRPIYMSLGFKWLIVCILNFCTIQILTSTFCISECISRLIQVTDSMELVIHLNLLTKVEFVNLFFTSSGLKNRAIALIPTRLQRNR